MFHFTIDTVAGALINQMKVFDCTIEVAWNDYMHSLITDQFTLEEVVNYIEDMEIAKIIEERETNDNGERYTLEDVKSLIEKNKRNKNLE